MASVARWKQNEIRSSKKILNMIEEKLEWHIYSKANEVSFDIHVTDTF
jgi:hypothetical protein